MSGESPGTLIGPYEVIQPLEGQASEVYLARRHGQERGPQFVLILFEVREVDARIIQADAERCRQIDHRAIIRLVEASNFFTVEKLAAEIAREILQDSKILEATVSVEKPGALRFARSVGVTITRHPGDFTA